MVDVNSDDVSVFWCVWWMFVCSMLVVIMLEVIGELMCVSWYV